jgi:sulfofructose kinase
MIMAELERFGIDISHVKVYAGARSATAAVIVDESGERFIVSEDDHAMPMTADWLPLDEIVDAGAVLSDLSWIEGTRAAFEVARAHHVPTLVDLDMGSGRLLTDVAHLTDYVIASAPALEAFIPGGDTEHRLQSLIAQGVRHVGVTRGPDGYTWMDREGTVHHQPAFAVQVRDTTGAGDAFHGAFTWALTEGHPEAECARLASAAAALSCLGLGARSGLPTRAELDAFLGERARAQSAGT